MFFVVFHLRFFPGLASGAVGLAALREPLVDALLGAASFGGACERLGFAEEGFRLAALDALGQVEAANLSDSDRGACGAAGKEGGGTAAGLCFDDPGDALLKRAALRDLAAARAFARSRGGECVFEAALLGDGRLERRAVLFFFELANAQQAADWLRTGHGLDLGGQRDEAAQSVGRADLLV